MATLSSDIKNKEHGTEASENLMLALSNTSLRHCFVV